MKIDGVTKLTGIIGYPLNYTLSPIIHNAAFDQLGINWCYLPLAVKEKDFPQAIPGLKALRFVGVNVTIPYKEKVLPWVDQLKSEAQMVKAVNTLHFQDDKVIGYNTDGLGFLAALREKGFDPQEERALLVGAGGAGKAVAFSLAQAGLAYLAILNRTPEKAQVLKEAIIKKFPLIKVDVLSFKDNLSPVFSRVRLLINATPVGMSLEKEEFPLPVKDLVSEHTVYDLIYWPPETPLLRTAQKKGAKVLSGLGMLLHQGALSFEIWTGIKPPLEVMRQVLLEAARKEGDLFMLRREEWPRMTTD